MEGFAVRCQLSCYILVVLLFLFLFSTNMKSCLAADTTNSYNQTNTQFIRTSCAITTYPKICFKSLSSYASSVGTSQKKLANAALTESLRSVRSTYAMVKNMSRRHDLKPREVAAVKDCVKEIGDSVDELRQSLKQLKNLGGSDVDFQMSSIKTWVSAAITDEDTCMDEFDGANMNGNVKSKIRKSVLSVARMTSNALALIDNLTYTNVHSP